MFDNIGSTAVHILAFLMAPSRIAMEGAGLHPSDLQVWALVVGLFMLAAGSPTLYGDIVLMRRRRHAVGKVVAIDVDNDGVRSPRIEFLDANRTRIHFASPLPAIGATATVGGTVPVIYDPQRPGRAREAGRPLIKLAGYVLWYGLAAGALVFAIGGAASVG